VSHRPLGVAGPIARSAADLELALDVLTAPEEPDRAAWSVRVPPSRHERLRDFRVALWADGEHFSVDRRCLEAMHEYADDLRRLGVQVDETARPEIDVAASDDLYVSMLFSVISGGMPEEVLALTEAVGAEADPRGYPARIARAVRLTAHEFGGLLEQQVHLCDAWRRFFERFDVILCPIMPTVAFPHDHSGEGPGHVQQYSRTTLVDGQPVPYMNGLQWPGLVTVANLPATAIPTGRRIDGMPMGVQAVGPYLEDRTPLRFAQLVERELGGYVPPPMAVPA
jgi:amidase